MMPGSSPFTTSLYLVEHWLELLITLDLANATIKAYCGALEHYLRYCEGKSLSPLDADGHPWVGAR